MKSVCRRAHHGCDGQLRSWTGPLEVLNLMLEAAEAVLVPVSVLASVVKDKVVVEVPLVLTMQQEQDKNSKGLVANNSETSPCTARFAHRRRRRRARGGRDTRSARRRRRRRARGGREICTRQQENNGKNLKTFFFLQHLSPKDFRWSSYPTSSPCSGHCARRRCGRRAHGRRATCTRQAAEQGKAAKTYCEDSLITAPVSTS